jgi:diamine N-acetyltransferase
MALPMQPLPQTTLAIREMQADDVPAVSELAARVWRAHYPSIISHEQIEYMLDLWYSPAPLKTQLDHPRTRFFLIEDNGALAGYLSAEEQKRGCWHIHKFYVDTARQRKGLGKMLFGHLTATAKPKMLTLRVNCKNYQAVNFYFRQGFVINACDVLELDRGYIMDDFLMRWEA